MFEGRNTLNDERVAIKVLKPTKDRRVRREIKILKALKGGPNIVEYHAAVKDPETENPAFVTEFIDMDGMKLRKVKKSFNEEDIRFYMYNILKALDYANSMGVMHRDIKASNIAIDHNNRKVYLIDWGLADFYHPGQ